MTNDIQPFIDNPQELTTQPIEIQMRVINNAATPRELLEVLVASENQEVARAAQNHVNWAGELTEDCHEAAEKLLRNSNLEQNDRLAVELLKFAPVPEWFFSKWVPHHRLCLANNYLPLRWQVQFLERLAREDSIEPRLRVAESPDTPVSILEELAGDLELPLRVAVRYNPNCPTETIAEVESQQAIASNWETDAQQLAELAENRWSWVRLAVAQNPSAPGEVLEKLAESDFDLIRLAIARNPSSPTAALEKLMESDRVSPGRDLTLRWEDKSILLALARHPNASERILLELLPRYSGAIAARTELPVSVIEKLIDESDRQYSLLQQQNLTPALLERLLEGASKYQRAEIAKHPQVTGSMLERLAEDSDPKVRLAVAQNPNTPEELRIRLLEELVGGSDENVKKAIARDPQTPISILERLTYEATRGQMFGELQQRGSQMTAELRESIEELLDIAPPWELISRLEEDENLREPILQQWERITELMTQEQVQDLTRFSGLMFGMGGGIALNTNRDSILRERPELLALYGLVGTLSMLAKSSKGYLAIALAENPSIRANLLESLWGTHNLQTDTGTAIAVAVCSNPKADGSLLETIERTYREVEVSRTTPNAGTYYSKVRSAIAKNRAALEEEAIADNRTQEASELLEPLTVYRTELEAEERQQERQGRELMAKRTESPYSLAEVLKGGNDSARFYAARNSKTPVSVLEQLAKDPVEGVRLELAQNPSLPPNVRLELADDPSDRVRMELARERYRQKTPAEVLERLAADSSESVRELVAQNPETPSSVLGNLADDNARKVRLAVAQNLNTPASGLREIARKNPELKEKMLWRKPSGNEESDRFLVELIEEFASSADDSIRYKIAGHPKTPISILERLAFDEYKLVRLGVAQNPNTPPRLLIQMASRDRVTTASGCAHTVSHAIAERSDAPAEALDFIARQPVDWIRAMALGNANTSAETLARSAASESDEWLLCRLAKHPNLSDEVALQVYRRENQAVRQSLASNSRLGASILEAIASDGAAEVRQQVGANSNAPVNLLEILAEDSVAEVRAAVAANANAPEQILERLAADDKIEVRRAVAKNPATPQPVLDSLQDLLPPPIELELRPTLRALGRLYRKETDDLPSLLSEYARSPKPFVRFVALRHPLTPAETLRGGSESLWWWERYAVADNPATPTEIREILGGDSNRIVRATAQLTIDN